MTYELWHTLSGNAMSEHPTLATALAAVREAFDRDGDRAVDALALIELDARGRSRIVADGAGLVSLLKANAPRR